MSRPRTPTGAGRAAGRLGLTLVLLAVAVPSAAQAAPSARALPSGVPGDDEAAAVALLRRAQASVDRWSWRGTEHVAHWGLGGTLATSVGVQHVPGSGTRAWLSGVDLAEGPAEVGGALSDGATPTTDPARTGPGRSVERLLTSYDLAVLGADRVAGRAALALAARRADGSTAGRVWVDARTGLVLRREVCDATGRLARSSTLVDVDVRRAVEGGAPAWWLPSSTLPEPVASGPVAAAARAQGYAVPAALGATLAMTSAEWVVLGPGSERALHLSYGDGLSTLSVFQQRGTLDAAAVPGLAAVQVGGGPVLVAPGVPARLTWQADGVVVSVVSDAPDDAVAAAVAALPHASVPEPDGWLDRLARGGTRLASWFNPLD